jgi:glycosyltransferase involved in cell wall biosynthesis
MFPLMAMAKPILYAGFGEGARMLEKVQGGWVVPPEKPEILKDKILEICKLDSQAKQAGENNLAFVKQELNFKTLVENWLKGVRL